MTYEAALKKVGNFGKYQKILCLILTLSGIPNGYLVLSIVFTGLKPQHRCTIPHIDDWNLSGNLNKTLMLQQFIPLKDDGKLDECSQYKSINETNSTVPCQNGWSYEIEGGRSSYVTEWNLVCENSAIRPVISSVFMVGVMFGSVISGILSDKFGRRPIFLGGTFLMFFFFALCSLANSPTMFIVIFFFSGMTNFINYVAAFILASETIDTSNRVITGTLTIGGFALGYMIIPLIAYLVPSWRNIYLICGLSGILYIPSYWLIPESPSWLYSRRRWTDFRVVMKKIAKTNGMWNSDLKFYLENIKEENDLEGDKGKSVENIWRVFLTKSVLMRMLNMLLTWFSASVTYYSLSFNTSNLGGNPYWNCFVAAAVELFAYAFVIVSLKFFGRKTITIVTMFLSGVFCMSIPLLLTVNEICSIVAAMLGKFFISACFAIIYIYCAELFPTCVRTTALGIASMSARIGSALAPFFIYLGENTLYLPYLIIFLLCLLSCLLTLFLPETNDRPIPETIDEMGDYSFLANFRRKRKKQKNGAEVADINEERKLMSKF